MSLRSALNQANDIEIKNGILTISDVDNNFNRSTLFSCFCEDISVYHSLYGMGKIIAFENNKWHVDFEACSSIQEFKTKTLLNYLPL
jgi:hypothetical protein